MTIKTIDTARNEATEAYGQLTNYWNAHIAGNQQASDLIWGGRFTTDMLRDGSVGYRDNDTVVVYGDWTPFGCLEGMLYLVRGITQEKAKQRKVSVRWNRTIDFDGHTSLRVRGNDLSVISVQGQAVQPDNVEVIVAAYEAATDHLQALTSALKVMVEAAEQLV